MRYWWLGQLAHIALPSVPSMPSVPNGLPWVIGENHVACWVSMDSIRHLESKYQIQNCCLIYLMPSPCPANAQSAQWAISGRYVTYWISMDSIHHWESKLTLFYVVHSFFFFFLGFPVFPVFLICMLVVTGDLSLPFILIGLVFLFTNTRLIHNTHWSIFFC